MTALQDFSIGSLTGNDNLTSELSGKVVLAVNVASKCGLTPQYTGLQQLHTDLADQNFSVVGFPCNQFGGQEPGTPEEIVVKLRQVEVLTSQGRAVVDTIRQSGITQSTSYLVAQRDLQTNQVRWIKGLEAGQCASSSGPCHI